MVMLAPVPIDAPTPHPPSYHCHDAPVPSEPPLTESVTFPPRQIWLYGALLEALVGSVEGMQPPVTVTLNVHVDVPHELVAVHVTVVVPFGNVLPDAGEQETVGFGVTVADGVEYVTTGFAVVI